MADRVAQHTHHAGPATDALVRPHPRHLRCGCLLLLCRLPLGGGFVSNQGKKLAHQVRQGPESY